jgi:Mg2+ and Co2+ transporter CorA
MVLRFQERDDVEREMKTARFSVLPMYIVFFVLIAACYALVDWWNDLSLKTYRKDLGSVFVFLCVFWLATALYIEFRARLREIDGKVSEIEKTVNASKEGHAEMLEKLAAIEEKLTEVQQARRI